MEKKAESVLCRGWQRVETVEKQQSYALKKQRGCEDYPPAGLASLQKGSQEERHPRELHDVHEPYRIDELHPAPAAFRY